MAKLEKHGLLITSSNNDFNQKIDIRTPDNGENNGLLFRATVNFTAQQQNVGLHDVYVSGLDVNDLLRKNRDDEYLYGGSFGFSRNMDRFSLWQVTSGISPKFITNLSIDDQVLVQNIVYRITQERNILAFWAMKPTGSNVLYLPKDLDQFTPQDHDRSVKDLAEAIDFLVASNPHQ